MRWLHTCLDVLEGTVLSLMGLLDTTIVHVATDRRLTLSCLTPQGQGEKRERGASCFQEAGQVKSILLALAGALFLAK